MSDVRTNIAVAPDEPRPFRPLVVIMYDAIIQPGRCPDTGGPLFRDGAVEAVINMRSDPVVQVYIVTDGSREEPALALQTAFPDHAHWLPHRVIGDARSDLTEEDPAKMSWIPESAWLSLKHRVPIRQARFLSLLRGLMDRGNVWLGEIPRGWSDLILVSNNPGQHLASPIAMGGYGVLLVGADGAPIGRTWVASQTTGRILDGFDGLHDLVRELMKIRSSSMNI